MHNNDYEKYLRFLLGKLNLFVHTYKHYLYQNGQIDLPKHFAEAIYNSRKCLVG